MRLGHSLQKQLVITWVVSVLMLFTFMPRLYADIGADELQMGVFPRRNKDLTHKLFKPLADHLSQALGQPVKLQIASDFATFWGNVAQGKYDIMHYNQLHYVKAHKKFGHQVIVSNIELNKSSIASSIIIRKDSGIKSIKDLKGKKVIFGGGVQAMVAYVGTVDMLHKFGLQQDRDYVKQFANNPTNACRAVFAGLADACGAGDVMLEIPYSKNIMDVSQMMVLKRGPALAHLPWAVSKDLPGKKIQLIQEAMLSLNKNESGRQLLKQMHLSGFARVSDADYDVYRETIFRVLQEKY